MRLCVANCVAFNIKDDVLARRANTSDVGLVYVGMILGLEVPKGRSVHSLKADSHSVLVQR